MLGHDPDQCSAMDVARYVDTGEDWPVEDGYGALVAKLAEGLSIRFNTSVLRINASGRLLKLETMYGDLTVSAAVVTVPTDVMAQGGLTFFPEPPAEFMQALVDCPMGVFEKIAVLLDRPIDGFDHAYADVIDGPPNRSSTSELARSTLRKTAIGRPPRRTTW